MLTAIASNPFYTITTTSTGGDRAPCVTAIRTKPSGTHLTSAHRLTLDLRTVAVTARMNSVC